MRNCLTSISEITTSRINIRIIILFALLIGLLFSPKESRAQTDSLHLDIEETVFTGRRNTSVIKKVDGSDIEVDLDGIRAMPQILGNSDPLTFVKMLPGVQTGSEYDSGIYIQGCDNAHNDFSISGVPVFGSTHLFGLFSIFNPSHYRKMTFSQSANTLSGSNRLGGLVSMQLPDSIDTKVSGDFTAGIMSSQGTLSFRLGKKSFLHASARRSYLGLLYKRWMYVDDSPIKYAFGDYNLTWHYSPGDRDKLWVDFYTGKDDAFISAERYNINLGLVWGNLAGAVHWEHIWDKARMRHTAFVSGYSSRALLGQDDARVEVPAYIGAAGYKAKVDWGSFSSGADVTTYRALPQAPVHEGMHGESGEYETQAGTEGDIWTDFARSFSNGTGVKAGLKASVYMDSGREFYWGLSPIVSASWNAYRWGKFNLSYDFRHQYIFQAGMSNIGLPMDFWYLSGRYGKPQKAHSLALNYKVDFFGGGLSLSADIYAKWLDSLAEYKGDLFDLFTTVYDLQNHLLIGKGRNYGINLMLHKLSGSFTGWISCSLGRALRSFDNSDYPGVYPANHERILDISAVGSYDVRKWNFSGTFVCSSGRPFTAPESFYISAGTIMTQYGEHNAARLRPYIRMDLSVNHAFRKDSKVENGINVSVYNVLARNNDVMWKLVVNDNGFAYRPASFFLKVMPSVSYYHKF